MRARGKAGKKRRLSSVFRYGQDQQRFRYVGWKRKRQRDDGQIGVYGVASPFRAASATATVWRWLDGRDVHIDQAETSRAVR